MYRSAVMMLGWLVLATAAHAGAPAHDDNALQNDWREERKGGEITLISNHPAPVPFSMSGEPEARLGMDAAIIQPGKQSLEEIVAEEVRDIRKELQIADYEEEDGRKPVDGIATWYETMDGTRVAFIKYRAMGLVGKPAGLPKTAIHSVLIRGNRVFYTHLIVLFAGHQDEVRHDQRVVIRSTITAPIKGAPRSQ